MLRNVLRRPGGLRRREGFTILEVLVAAALLIIVFFGLAQIYTRGRRQINWEEDRRKATAIAQARLDGIRRDYTYGQLPSLDGTDTTYVSDGREFVVTHEVVDETPEPRSTAVTVTVTWTVLVQGEDVERTLETTTILGQGMPAP